MGPGREEKSNAKQKILSVTWWGRTSTTTYEHQFFSIVFGTTKLKTTLCTKKKKTQKTTLIFSNYTFYKT